VCRLAALILVVLVAGCSAQSTMEHGRSASSRAEDLRGEPAVGPAQAVLDNAALRLPVEDYLPTVDQNDRLARAQVALIQACLHRWGFGYDVVPVPSGRYGPTSLTDRRYGITDLALASRYGYGLGPRDPALMTRPSPPKLDPDGVTVLSGQGRSVVAGLAVPAGGCIGEASRQLAGSLSSADLRRGSDLQAASFGQSRVDSRVRAVFQAWSSCVARSGYRYADPLAAAADPAFTGPADQHQLDVAAADIACKASTNLVGVWFTVEAAYEARAIAADPDGFAATRSAIAARDRLAAAALAS
jgi:hypothetical protein